MSDREKQALEKIKAVWNDLDERSKGRIEGRAEQIMEDKKKEKAETEEK